MMVLKDIQGNVIHRYIYTAIRHVVEPESNTDKLLVTLANKVEPNGGWDYARLDFNEEDLTNFMTFNSQGNLSLRESVAFKVYEIAKSKGLIPQEAVNE